MEVPRKIFFLTYNGSFTEEKKLAFYTLQLKKKYGEKKSQCLENSHSKLVKTRKIRKFSFSHHLHNMSEDIFLFFATHGK